MDTELFSIKSGIKPEPTKSINICEDEYVELIVEYNSDIKKEKLLKSIGRIKYDIPIINSYVMEIKKNHLNKINSLIGINSIHSNSNISAQMNTAKTMLHANSAISRGITGNGIGVAILDTGISPVDDFTMPNDRIVAFKDFVNGKSNAYDDNGHGTHVTGIACGNGYNSRGKYMGIAPESDIISIKILDENGQGNSTQALAGIQWIIDNKRKYNIRVANLSIGTNDRNINIPLAKAINAAWDMGIVVIAAAGNPGSRNAAISPMPGSNRKIIVVGSSEDKYEYFLSNEYNNDYLSGPIYTKSGNRPDVLAPGTDIISCMSPNYSFDFANRDEFKIVDTYYVKMSGTSMSTPMISGAAALILQKNPSLSPDEVKKILISSSSMDKGVIDIEKIFLRRY